MWADSSYRRLGSTRTWSGNRPSGDGWRVTVAAHRRNGTSPSRRSPFASKTETLKSSKLRPPRPGRRPWATASCPGGTALTGGGWWADPFLEVVHNEPTTSGGWFVQASGRADQ